MSKKMCDKDKKGTKGKNPKYVCKECDAHVAKKKMVCKPEKLKNHKAA